MGRCRQQLGGIEMEILAWHDLQGQAYPTTDELRSQLDGEMKWAEAEHQRAEDLAQYLRSLGVDPDHLP